MKQSLYFWNLLCLIATPLLAIAQTGTNNRLLFTTDLNGGQEVPAVQTDARGIATILISEDRTTMSVHAVFSGLSGPVTGCHIHTGGESVAGPVFVNFSNNVTGNRLRAEMPIPADFMRKALKNELYLNVHTALNPGGEIRGQLGLKTENVYAIVLSGANETPPVTSTASGVGYLAHSSGNFFMRYAIEYNGLSGPVTAAHFHSGAAGVAGPVVVGLSAGVTNTLVGTLELTSLPIDFLQKLDNGTLYANIHTAANPGGEIRGQLIPLGPVAFAATLNGDQETPPVTTSANGIAIASLNATLDSVLYYVGANGLTPTAAHFHTGVGGIADPVLFGLQTTSMPNFYTGKTALTDAAVTNWLNGRIYANIHTAANPGGEIRGQMEPYLRRVYAFDLCAEQETPPNASAAQGAAYITTDLLNTHLEYRYIVDGLSGPATAAHIHDGAFGTAGPVYLPVFTPSPVGSGQFPITGNDVVKLESGDTYLNIHTAANPGGEIRGQVRRQLACSVNVSVREPAAEILSVFPNPVTERAEIQLYVKEAFEGQLLLLEPGGKTVLTKNYNMESGPQQMSLDLTNLPTGLYFAQIRSDQHGLVRAFKLVKS